MAKSKDLLPTRIELAKTHNNEKGGSRPVGADLVLASALSTVCVNGLRLPIHKVNRSGVMLNWREIERIEHDCVVLVENLAVMTALAQLQLPDELQGALFLYRGDANDNHTSAAYQWFRQLTHVNKVVFADFDPAGIEIAISSGAEWALLPQQAQWEYLLHPQWQQLIGAESRFYAQRESLNGLAERTNKPEWGEQLLRTMGKHRQTRTQEHLIAHQVPLALFPL
ncbi:hypothetical protein [uncultured Ferrimonas sp.]|uniref:DUF7281 domain-containing protein n=1 Tax=uncultured Ferrimonas sp. TaxID=432640 RepID=UPI0026278AC1|nr:hypothetical protein [uncultured Ferrimonas sp.]